MVNGVPTGGLIQFVHQPSRQRDPLGPIAHHDGMRVTTGCHPCNVPDRTDNRSNLMQLLQGLSMAQKEDPCNIVIGNPAQALQQLHEIGTIIRSVGGVTWVTSCSDPHAIVMRNRAERVALAAWLVNELDKPTSGHAINHGGIPPEFQLSDDPENLVRVYYLAGSQSEEAYQKVIDQVRRAARTYRSFIYTALGALVVRGSAGQLALAEKVIEEMKAQ